MSPFFCLLLNGFFVYRYFISIRLENKNKRIIFLNKKNYKNRNITFQLIEFLLFFKRNLITFLLKKYLIPDFYDKFSNFVNFVSDQI